MIEFFKNKQFIAIIGINILLIGITFKLLSDRCQKLEDKIAYKQKTPIINKIKYNNSSIKNPLIKNMTTIASTSSPHEDEDEDGDEDLDLDMEIEDELKLLEEEKLN